jgi:hypothetical protein
MTHILFGFTNGEYVAVMLDKSCEFDLGTTSYFWALTSSSNLLVLLAWNFLNPCFARLAPFEMHEVVFQA